MWNIKWHWNYIEKWLKLNNLVTIFMTIPLYSLYVPLHNYLFGGCERESSCYTICFFMVPRILSDCAGVSFIYWVTLLAICSNRSKMFLSFNWCVNEGSAQKSKHCIQAKCIKILKRCACIPTMKSSAHMQKRSVTRLLYLRVASRPVRECCWQTAGMSQCLSLITSLQLAPICHMKAEKYLMWAGWVVGGGAALQ